MKKYIISPFASSQPPMKVLARASEQEKLRQLMSSEKPELVAIYGRRRVGKTFTVSQTLRENPSALYFEITGSLREDGRAQSQREFLGDFSVAWHGWMKTRRSIRSPEDCLMALSELVDVAVEDRPVFLFLDELPWIARSSPRFFSGLATLWNNRLSKSPHVKLFVAGSATSWMIEHVIHAGAGLAKRVTAKIHMRSLDLAQTSQFLKARGLRMSHNDVFRIYSVLGGIPYYLAVLDPRISPAENLYRLLVEKDGLLFAGTEYEELFRYLFARDGAYRKVIDTLAGRKHGMSYADLALAISGGEKPSGGLLRVLENLESSELIARRQTLLNRSKGARLFITDEYIRFVSRWLRGSQVTSYAAFSRIFSSQSYAAWQGFDDDLIAFKNAHLIIHELGLSGVAVEPFIYYKEEHVQVDLLLRRADRTITLCEAKSHDSAYEPTKEDVTSFHTRRKAIQDFLKERREPEHFINYCFVVRNGVKRNRYFNEINPLVVDLSSVL